MADQIASLYAKIGADIGDFQSALGKVKSDMSGLEKAFGGLQSAVGTGLKVAAGIGVAAVGGLATVIGSSIKSAADMEQGIANIAATMNLTKDETDKLKATITDLGLDPKLKVTAVEAAQAIDMLGKNGLTLEQIMGGAARSTVLLSNSTGGDFAMAADLATDVMSLFNIEAANMTSAVDAITGVTVASKFSVDDYRLAVAQAGGVASAVGVTFDDFNAAIAAISPSFAGGSDAGTSFKVFLQRLVPSTDKAKTAMMELGLSTGEDVVTAFFKADGSMRPMEEIAQNLHKAFSGLSDAQRNEAASTIFGTDAMRAALALADAGGQIITDFKTKIGDTSAEDAAATRMDTLRGAWEIFQGVVETLSFGIGDKFLPVARKLAEWLTELANQYGPPAIEWFGRLAEQLTIGVDWLLKVIETGNIFNETFTALPRPIQSVITVTYDLVQGIVAFLSPIVNAISYVVQWQDVLGAVAVVILSIAVPAVWGFIAAATPIIALFAAIVAGIAVLRNAWESDFLGIRTVTTQVWEIITGVFNSVAIKVGWIVDTFKEQWAILQAANATLGEKLALIWNTLLALAETVWQGIVTTVLILWPKFVAALKEWGNAAWEWLQIAIPVALQKLGEWGETLWKWLSSNLPKWLDALANWAQAAWEWLLNATTTALNKLGEWGAALWGWLAANLPTWWQTLLVWAQAAWQWIVEATAAALTKLGEWGKALWDWLAANLPTWLQRLGEWGKGAWEWIVQAAGPALAKLAEWGTALWDWLTGNLTTWLQKLAAWGRAAWEWIVQATGPALTKLGEWGSSLLQWLAANLPNWLATLYEWMTALVDWLADAIPGAIRNLTEFVRSLREEGSGPGLSSFMTMASEWAVALWRWIVDELIPTVGPKFRDYIAALLNLGSELLKSLGELAVELGKTLWQWIVEITPVALAKLKEWGTALWGWLKENMPTWVQHLLAWADAAWQWIRDVALPLARQKLGEWGTALWEWVKQNAPTWAQKLGEWARAAWEWIVEVTPVALQKLGDFGRQLLGWVSEKARDWVTAFLNAGRDIVDGLRQGIEQKWNGLTSWFRDRWEDMVRGFKNFFGIHSPSTLFADFGSDMMTGLANGISGASNGPINAVNYLATQVQAKVNGMVDAVRNSVTDINNQLNSIGGGTGAGGGTGGSSGGSGGWVPPPIAEKDAAIAYGGYKLGVGVNQVQGLTDVGGFATEFMTFIDKLGTMIGTYGLAPSGSAQGQALQILQSGSVFDQKIDDVLGSIQLLLRALRDNGLGNQFFIEAPPNEDLNAKYELIALVEYLQALYG